jgi:2-C-methyl-D-erythritol 4-phosphate cytidylyltransferase/2-C-methyl-D-erythritol 2,4-cyclodiphosphate synthase
MTNSALFVVIAASGTSSRMGGEKKEFRALSETAGDSVLTRSVGAFLPFVPSRIVITLPADNFDAHKARAEDLLCPSGAFDERALQTIAYARGGKERSESVFNALCFLDENETQSKKESAVVLIHDAARPWVDAALVGRVLQAARQNGAACPGIPPVDTLKESGRDGFVRRHLERSKLFCAQTPQGFWFAPFFFAHKKARAAAQQKRAFTDDTEIWDKYAAKDGAHNPCALVEGSLCNSKITFPSDLGAKDRAACEPATAPPRFRTGLGYDIHPLVPNRVLVLGGVVIPFDKGEAGHSDGDALLHAITDALLGAAALGDIGSFFPPDDAAYKAADSRALLFVAWDAVTRARWRLENLDCVIELEAPKFLPHRDAVRDSIAGVLGVSRERVFVKAKTGEKMGDVGRGAAVKVWAACLLQSL